MMRFALLAAAALRVIHGRGASPTIQIAPGVRMPFVVLGTGSGQKGSVENATALWLRQAGGVGIDTAYGYGDEGEIAKGIAAAHKARSDVFIETKVPCTSYAHARADLEGNLQQLGVEQVDLVLVHHSGDAHSPCDPGGSVSETWRAMEEFLVAGKARSLGVSHATAVDLEKLRKTATVWPPAVNQCELSVVFHDDATIEYCRAHGITYQSFSPLCGGFNGCARSACTLALPLPRSRALASAHL